MKGIVLILLTILVALYMINECEGRRRRRYRYWRRGLTIQGRPKSLPLNTGDKRETMNDMQDEDIETVDSEYGHLDERYVDMDNVDDIDERYVNDPEEDDQLTH
uniref:Myticalin C9 n=1 Tax=Mytilus chilensis TaxID=173667 RepID=A0A286RMV3_MYTCH|nr:myticalin C9 [Mytilus chilensis]